MDDDPSMKFRALPGLVVLPLVVVGVLASPAHAATSQGCSGSLSSEAAQAAPLDTVSVPGPGATTKDPFRLLWGDPVTWTGQTAQPVTTGTWRLTVERPSWLFALGQLVSGHPHGLSGTFDTGQGAQTFTNSFTPSDIEPVTLPGTYDVAFSVTGDGGVQCTGTLTVRVIDSPFRNPLFWLASLLAVAGLVMLFAFGVTKLTRPVYIRSGEREGMK
jgi:hypothetical protein